MHKKILLMFLFQNICLGSEALYDKSEEINNILNSNPYQPNYISMLFGLGIVIFLIYLTGFIYQKLIKVKIADNDDILKNQIKILSSQSLGQGKNLHVIQIDNKKILVGATQNNISCVCKLDSDTITGEQDDKSC